MLVLTRKVGERFLIGGSVIVTVVAAVKGQTRIGIEAPITVKILREELLAQPVVACTLDCPAVGNPAAAMDPPIPARS